MINREKRNIRIIADQRKKISIGYKTKKGLPKSANFFVTENPETKENYYPEITALYGANPDKIYISFPSDILTDFYRDGYNLYGSNGVKKRMCDGIECEHYLDETIDGVKYSAGECSGCVCEIYNLNETNKSIACKCDLYLTAYILHPQTLRPISPICYLFVNHSKNSADNIYTELSRYSKFIGYPFVLSVKEIKKANSKFSLLYLQPYINSEFLIDFNLKATEKMNELYSGGTALISEGPEPEATEIITELNEMSEQISDESDYADFEIEESDSEDPDNRDMTEDEAVRFKAKYIELVMKLNADTDEKIKKFCCDPGKVTNYLKAKEIINKILKLI